MTMKPRKVVPAGKFKAECLALLDEVAHTGEPLVITKRGKPVARIVPVVEEDLVASLRGSVTLHGDIVEPVLDAWDADR